MRGYMFRNRWLALLFVAMTLAAVTRLVGTEEDAGALDKAAEQIIAQKQAAETSAGSPPSGQAAPDDVIVEFTPDEELIDPASGEDPTPIDEFAQAQADPAAVPHDEVVIVSQGTPAATPAPQ